MKEAGVFKYKVNLYQYCERFMIAFDDKHYGEMVLHPPPISYLATIMIPFSFSSFLMKYVTKTFSYLMYWVENTFFLCGFLTIEMVLMPFAYLKIWSNIIASTLGFLKTIVNCLSWAILGVPMMLYLILRDCCYLLNILGHH